MASELPSVLEKIVAQKRKEVAAGKAARARFDVAGSPPTRGFARAISRSVPEAGGSVTEIRPLRGHPTREAGSRHEERKVRLIAEVKHASPVKGVLRENFDPIELGRTYAENGAAALSVLTDERFFMGHPDYLRQIREVVSVPLLRKEFIIDEWQLAESRALGADAVLLIAAILSRNQLREYLEVTHSLGMDALVEVHTEAELDAALASGARIVGVNNRNLHTFVTDLAVTERFAERVKGGVGGTHGAEGSGGTHGGTGTHGGVPLLVSESGINRAADVERLAAMGVDAVLVGEALVRETDVGAKVRELAGR